jgi:hypothetical protein
MSAQLERELAVAVLDVRIRERLDRMAKGKRHARLLRTDRCRQLRRGVD